MRTEFRNYFPSRNLFFAPNSSFFCSCFCWHFPLHGNIKITVLYQIKKNNYHLSLAVANNWRLHWYHGRLHWLYSYMQYVLVISSRLQQLPAQRLFHASWYLYCSFSVPCVSLLVTTHQDPCNPFMWTPLCIVTLPYCGKQFQIITTTI